MGTQHQFAFELRERVRNPRYQPGNKVGVVVKANDGGPAFPESGSRGLAASGEGMSLRDYFAAKALAALILTAEKHDRITRDDIVGESYFYADAMLRARE